jgi:hypothetical protein
MSKIYVDEILPKENARITAPNLQLPAGSVIQVVSTTKNDVASTTSTSFTDVSGLSVSITPSSTSSKILVLVNVMLGSTGDAGIKLQRDSTDIAIGTGSTAFNCLGQSAPGPGNDLQYAPQNASISHLDSPNTTSATTYKIQFRTNGSGTVYINTRAIAASFIGASSITLMEIAQ